MTDKKNCCSNSPYRFWAHTGSIPWATSISTTSQLRKGTAGFASVCFPDFCHPHRYNLQGENIGILINHELPIYIRYVRTALNECSMLLALLAIWTNADYSWPKPLTMCCAGGRRWCCAGSPSALMVLLCVWCVVGIGARAHQERGKRERDTYCGPQSSSAPACVCAYASTSPTGCWREASRAWVG